MNIVQPIARLASSRPHSTAFITPQGTITYAQAVTAVSRIAARMVQLGVRPGDVVGIQARESLTHAWLTLAIAWAGGVSVSLAIEGNAEDRLHMAKLCGARFFFRGENDTELELPGLVARATMRELLAATGAPKVPIAQREPDDLCRIGFSSGTSGRPKAIKFSHECMTMRTWLPATLVPMGPKDRVLVQIGPGLVFALTYWLRALTVGATLVARDNDPQQCWQSIERHGVTYMVSSPGNALQVVTAARQTPGASGLPKALRALIVGGAPVQPGQRRLLREHLCPQLWISYGATELGAVALVSPELMDRMPDCAGRVIDWVDMQAVNEHAQPLPAGATGLLRMRSAAMASGYILAADANPEDAHAFRDGWFYSKDLGRVEQSGLLYLFGRAGDVFNLGGTKVDPARVEEAFCSEPDVLDCAVVRGTDRSGASVLVIAIVPHGELDWADLRRRCAVKLPPTLMPRAYAVMDELPRNAAGKINRGEVARGIEAQLRVPAEVR